MRKENAMRWAILAIAAACTLAPVLAEEAEVSGGLPGHAILVMGGQVYELTRAWGGGFDLHRPPDPDGAANKWDDIVVERFYNADDTSWLEWYGTGEPTNPTPHPVPRPRNGRVVYIDASGAQARGMAFYAGVPVAYSVSLHKVADDETPALVERLRIRPRAVRYMSLRRSEMEKAEPRARIGLVMLAGPTTQVDFGWWSAKSFQPLPPPAPPDADVVPSPPRQALELRGPMTLGRRELVAWLNEAASGNDRGRELALVLVDDQGGSTRVPLGRCKLAGYNLSPPAEHPLPIAEGIAIILEGPQILEQGQE